MLYTLVCTFSIVYCEKKTMFYTLVYIVVLL